MEPATPPAPAGGPPKTPRWVWALAGAAALLAVGLLAAHLLAGGSMGHH